MRTERFASSAEAGTIGPGVLILAAVGCFTIGFAALMIVPRVWPRYVQTPVAVDATPLRVAEAGTQAPALVRNVAVPGVVTELRTGGTSEPQRIASFGTLAGLTECKAALRSGGTFANVGAEQMAAMLGTRGKALTSAQIDAGCRKLAE